MLMNICHTWNDQLSRIIKNGDRLILLWQILEYADDGIFFTDNIGVLEDLKPFRGRGVDNVPLQCKNRCIHKNLSVIFLSGHAIIRNSQGSRRTVSFASCDKQQ